MGFSKKIHLFQTAKGGKFSVECISNRMISLKCLFRPNYEVFLAKKKQKLFNVGKIRKYDEEGVFFEKKTFSSF